MPEVVAKDKGGRPPKLTKEAETTIVNVIRSGGYATDAAALAGISRATLQDWTRMGARAKSGIYKRFSDRVKKANAEFVGECLNGIRTAGSGYKLRTSKVIQTKNDKGVLEASQTVIEETEKREWQALAWILERKDPEKWGRREHIEVSGDPDNPIIADQKVPDILSGDYLAKWLVALTEVNLAPIDLVKMIDVTPMNGTNGNGSAE